MKTIRNLIALLLCFSVFVYAQGNAFSKVRYNGGSISTKVSPEDWDNKLTISTDAITFQLKDGQSVSIPPSKVSSLSYGQEAHRRVGTAIGLAAISLGIGLLFTLHKTKLHYIGINYTDDAGKKQGLLIQGDKSNFRAILVALQGVTGAPIAVAEKERGEIPAGITATSLKEPEQQTQPANATKAAGTAPAQQTAPGVVKLTATPESAEIYVDGEFVGNAPATLKLAPGKHTIKVTMTGYKDWSRDLTAQTGTETNLNATLEKAGQ